MQFGVQFFPNFQPKDKSAEEYFAQSLDIAEEADTLGFTHARSVEHYFERYGGYSPNPILFLAAGGWRWPQGWVFLVEFGISSRGGALSQRL